MLKQAAHLALVALVASAASAQEEKAKAPARVVITAELVGVSDAPALKIDKDTQVLLDGKAAAGLGRPEGAPKVVVAEGVLSRNADKRLVLTCVKVTPHAAGDKGVPAPGQARVAGLPICGSCTLGLCDECTLAVDNKASPVILDGDLATKYHAEEAEAVTATGTLFVDKRGLVRLLASKVELKKKA